MADDDNAFLIVEPDHQIVLITKYLNKEIHFDDLQASLGLSRSNLRRRIKRFREMGPDGLKRKQRARGGNYHSPQFKDEVLAIVEEHYPDFGPTFAAEKLLERHGLEITEATLRRWMIKAGLWESRRDREPKIYSPRQQRERMGELVQVDGSYHRWFEKRGPEACLICFIDDATSEIMHLRMVDNESSFNYMRCLKWYIEQYGRPLALYSDKYSVFRSTNENSTGDRNPTQFARACHNLGIQVICASSPQAKGRVERSFRTLQDRLVKEMRIAHISTIEEANWFLESYRQAHNLRFAKPPLNPADAHAPCGNIDIRQLLTYNVSRKVFKDLTVNFNDVHP